MERLIAGNVVLPILFVALGSPAWAQAAVPPAETQRPAKVAIKAGRLLDVRSGQAASGVVILVEGDRIVSVGGAVPSGVSVIDLSGLTVLPGLIDAHDHIMGDLKDLSSTAALRMSAPQAAIWGVHNLQVMLDHGFTGMRDACEDAGWAYGQVALRNSVAKGLIRGPRMTVAGNCISLTGGHGDEDVLAPDRALGRLPNIADTVDQMDIAVRHDIKFGADWIKLMATGGVGDPTSDGARRRHRGDQGRRARGRGLDRARHVPRRGGGRAPGRTRHLAGSDARDVPARRGRGRLPRRGRSQRHQDESDPADAAVGL